MIDLESLADPGTFERQLAEEIDLARLPRHIAVIMDGNGRWAKQRGSPRVEGHRAGIASVRETVETCARLELDALTLYAFSVENWKRPRFEIVTLMSLLKEFLAKELSNLLKNDIRFRVVGRMNELDASVQKALSHGHEDVDHDRRREEERREHQRDRDGGGELALHAMREARGVRREAKPERLWRNTPTPYPCA